MMSHRFRFLSAALFALALACARMTQSVATTGEPRVDEELDRLRTATRPFQSLDSAVAAGYSRNVPDCFIHEHHGAMGYHHVNRSYLTASPSLGQPAILLYERTRDGAYKLNGVEYIVPYRLYSRDSAPPVLMGQKFHHEDRLNYWYLHVWAWTNNADGVFADFNPAVTCPGATGKVYRAFSLDGA